MSNINKKLVIGTRKSKLAMIQAEYIRQEIHHKCNIDLENIELKPIITTGDKIQDRNLAEIGGKGLFTQEIEQQLQNGEIDFAAHSMKDMPSELPENLEIAAILPREDPRDVLLGASDIDSIKENGKFGTSSTRRKHLIKYLRPDLEVIPFRGNVFTRLDKLQNKVADATCLALSGIKRLNLENEIEYSILDPKIFVPAITQGALGVEINIKNQQAVEIAAKINDAHSLQVIRLERLFLKYLDGSCSTPVGGLCEIIGENVAMHVMVINQQTGKIYHEYIDTKLDNAEKIIIDTALHMKKLL